jgi:phycoerythrin-associated linker protein
MNNTFVNPAIAKASELGIGLYEDTSPIELWRGCSQAEIEIVIQAVYKQVLGNAHVMESERLTVPESQLKNQEISVREFVGQVARSELYQSRFFDNCPRYRSIELNFKHLLGRAPESYEEMVAHSEILDRYGYEAEINSYIDSDEYWNAFGQNIVPYYRGYKTQTGKNMVGFTYLFKLLGGASSSDKNIIRGNSSRLNTSIIGNKAIGVSVPSGTGTTDVNQLLASLFKPKSSVPETPPTNYQSSFQQPVASSELERQSQQQQQQIEKLQQQLAELQPVANIGAAQLNKWQSGDRDSSFASKQQISQQGDRSLQMQVESQKTDIANLEQKIAELRSLATIGEARLNKWRNRFFS